MTSFMIAKLPVVVYDDDQTTADEKDNHIENSSHNNSDVELDYDKTNTAY